VGAICAHQGREQPQVKRGLGKGGAEGREGGRGEGREDIRVSRGTGGAVCAHQGREQPQVKRGKGSRVRERGNLK